MLALLYYVCVFFIIGSGITLFFLESLNIKNSFHYILFSVINGLIISNLTFLTIGQFGFKITGLNMYAIHSALIIASLILFFKNKTKLMIVKNIFNLKIEWSYGFILNLVGLIIITFFFSIYFRINARNYFPSWDEFTFWLIDAKIIFTTGRLRNSTELIRMSNTSYHPLHAVYIYNFYGYIREQTASVFNILYALLANLMILKFISKKKSFPKFISIISLMMVNYYLTEFIFIYYSEIIITFHVLYFVYTSLQNIHIEHYYQKYIILLTNFLLISIIKDRMIIYAILLIFIFLFRNLKKVKKKLNKKQSRALIFFMIVIIIYAISSYHYSNFINTKFQSKSISFTSSNIVKLKRLMSFEKISAYRSYLKKLFTQIFNHYKYLIIYFILSLPLLIIKKFKNKILIYIILISIPSLLYYIINMSQLRSESILRYISYSFYLIPIYYSLYNIQSIQINSINKKILSTLALVVIIGLSFISLIKINNSYNTQDNNISGVYKDYRWIKNDYIKANLIKKNVSNDSKLLIISHSYNSITNQTMKAELLKYYLTDYTIGSKLWLNYEKAKYFNYYISEKKPDYILLLYNQKKNIHLEKFFSEYDLIPDNYYLFKISQYKPLDMNLIYQTKSAY